MVQKDVTMITIFLVVNYKGDCVNFVHQIFQVLCRNFFTISQKFNVLELELLCVLLLLVVVCILSHMQQKIEYNQCQSPHCFGVAIVTILG